MWVSLRQSLAVELVVFLPPTWVFLCGQPINPWLCGMTWSKDYAKGLLFGKEVTYPKEEG